MGRGKRDFILKIASVTICALMVISSLTLVTMPTNVKADSVPSEGKSLDYNFMWFNVTENLSNVVYKYPSTEKIIKGRSFGTWGDRYTAEHILEPNMTKIGLENVKLLPLGPIQYHTLIEPYREWYYTGKLEVLDFNLTVNHPYFSYHDTVNGRLPYNETFAFPSGFKNKIPLTPKDKDLDYNHTFKDIRLLPLNITDDWNLFGGKFTGQWYNVTNCTALNCLPVFVGNATYVENTSSLPKDQDGRVILIDEEAGCEEILDNITNASTVVLMQGDSKYSVNQTTINNCVSQIIQVGKNETNLTTVINELKNGTDMMVDNYYDNKTMTFTYGFGDHLNWNWPEYNFSIILWVGGVYLYNLFWNSIAIWLCNIESFE